MFKGQSPKNFRSKLIIYSNTMTPEDTWGCSTLHSCLPTSKTHQREIQSADCLLIGNIGFICLASGWALTAKSRQGSSDRAGEAWRTSSRAAGSSGNPQAGGKKWRQWWRTSGRAVKSKKTGTMKLVLGKESDQCHILLPLPGLKIKSQTRLREKGFLPWYSFKDP